MGTGNEDGTTGYEGYLASQAETQQGIVQKSENLVLRSLLGEYMNMTIVFSEQMKSLSNKISVPEFEKLIPQI